MTVYKVKQCEADIKNTGPKIGVRHVQILLLFLAGTVSFWTRISVSMAVVAMTYKNSKNLQTFDWTEEQKSYIFSGFSVGNILTQVLAGYFGKRYGTRFILLCSLTVPSLLTLLTPPCVVLGGWKAFCAIRVIQGFTSTGLFPLFHIHLTKWSPVKERNRLGTFTYAGMTFGIILAFLLSGLLAASSLGWPSIFYVPGSIGLLWAVCWFFYGMNSPGDCKSITTGEKNYIESSSEQSEDTHKIPTPWIAIFKSAPFWCLMFVRVSTAWSGNVLLTQIPAYMNGVLKLNMSVNAVYSSLPFIVTFFVGFLYLFIADLLARKGRVSLTVIRKSFSTLAEFGGAVTFIGFGFIKADKAVWAMVLLSICVSFSSAGTIGSGLTHIDMAPNHAGVLMGILNTNMDFIGIIAPVIIGKIVTSNENQTQWQTVFFITATLHVLANITYLIFGKMEKQWWNDPDQKEQDKNNSPA